MLHTVFSATVGNSSLYTCSALLVNKGILRKAGLRGTRCLAVPYATQIPGPVRNYAAESCHTHVSNQVTSVHSALWPDPMNAEHLKTASALDPGGKAGKLSGCISPGVTGSFL